jgi:hypothetical protein
MDGVWAGGLGDRMEVSEHGVRDGLACVHGVFA